MPSFPAADETTVPPWHVRLAAKRTCSAMQLAALDGHRGDLGWIIDGLDDAEIREVAREMTVIWCQAITLAGYRTGMRDAVAADAMAQAAMGAGQP